MPYSTTFLVAVSQLLDEPGMKSASLTSRFGFKFVAATIGATSLTTLDPTIVALYSVVTSANTFLRNWHIYLETAGESRIVTTGSISGSTVTLSFTGGASATTQAGATNVYLLRHCSWTELRDAYNDCLEYIPLECMIPLAAGPTDYDLQDSDTVDASWTESNATDTVQTTAAEVWAGARSLVVTDSGSGGGYTASGNVRMGHSESGTAFAIVKSDTGTSALRVTDDGGNTLETVETTQEDWVFIKKRFTLASDDEGAALRLLESTASAAGDWQFAWITRDNGRIFRLPHWIDERFKVKGVARATFAEAGDEADTWLADTVEFTMLRDYGNDAEWRGVFRQADANPHMILLEPYVRTDEPLFLIVQSTYALPYGVAATFTTDAATTTCPPHLLTARIKAWIGAQYPEEYPGLEERGRREYAARTAIRQSDPPKQQVRMSGMFSGR